eukprot:3199302-Amphidinium_carterae.1
MMLIIDSAEDIALRNGETRMEDLILIVCVRVRERTCGLLLVRCTVHLCAAVVAHSCHSSKSSS